MTEYGEVFLIPQSEKQDCIGQPIDIDNELKAIECKVESVGRSEWSTAAQGGYQAEVLLKVFRACYHGEKIALYHDNRYEIYRTYGVGDEIELYLGTRIGEYLG